MITYVVAEDDEDEDGEGEGRNDDDAKVDDDDDDDDDDKKRISGVFVSKGESWSYTNPMMVSDEPHKPRRATVKEKPSSGEDHGHHQPQHGVLSAKKKRENMKSKTAQSLDSANILFDSDTHRLSTIIAGDDVIITANKYADDDRHERSSVARASADAKKDNLHSDPMRSSAEVDDNFQSILRESASSKESSSGGGDG
ncbi:hypothetical protein HELRODRAFT_184759, partial [Helobdella robusta]|uniref:Uncharacterized protein n=1 Tax=Helobdella robusta TaxID=6412 RepID=T1FLX9_HELRO